jgi:hypothetical protein
MSVIAGRPGLNGRADLGLAGKPAGPKVAVCRVICRRIVDKTGKGVHNSLLLGCRSGRRCDGSQGYL